MPSIENLLVSIVGQHKAGTIPLAPGRAEKQHQRHQTSDPGRRSNQMQRIGGEMQLSQLVGC